MAIKDKIKSLFKRPEKRQSEAFAKARKDGKKTFKGDFSKSAIDKGSAAGQKTAGDLEFSSMTKEEVAKKIKKAKESSGRRPNDSRPKAVYEKATGTKVSSRGQAFAKARKEGKDSFMFEGKRYSTRLKGEKRPATPKISSQAARDGGRIGYKRGGGVGCAKRGFGRALKK
mgnify:CR=1 FL=1